MASDYDRRRRNERAESAWRNLGMAPPSQYGHGAAKLGWDPNSQFSSDSDRQAFYDQMMGSLDEFGNSMFLPGSDIAPDVQHAANIKARQRNDRLLSDAGTAGQGLFASAQGALQSGARSRVR